MWLMCVHMRVGVGCVWLMCVHVRVGVGCGCVWVCVWGGAGIRTNGPTQMHGVRHGFKIGGPKPLLNLKVSRSLILIYKFIKLSKILIHAFKY